MAQASRASKANYTVLVIACVLTLLPQIGHAGPPDCHDINSTTIIEDCSRQIESGQYKGRELAVLYNDRGLQIMKAGDKTRAITDFDKALAADTALASAWYNRGLANYGIGDLDKAIADYNRAAELAPERAEIWNNRGLAFAHKGHQDKALADYTKAIQLDPKMAIAWMNRGRIYAQKGEFQLCAKDIAEAVRLEPQNKEFVDRLAEIRAKLAK